jgi:hypothetical protein
MFAGFCLSSIKMFTLKIKLHFLSKICNFFKKLLCKVSIISIYRLGRKVYHKDKKKWGLSFKKIGDDVMAQNTRR